MPSFHRSKLSPAPSAAAPGSPFMPRRISGLLLRRGPRACITPSLLLLLVGLVGLLGLAAGCSSGPSTAEVGAALPSFSLQSLSGETVRSADFQGLPTVISVWATWCQPCLKEIPLLQQLHADPRFRVITIALDETGADTVAPFVEERDLSYPVLLGNPETFQSLGGFAIPHNVLVTPDGTVADIIRGLLDEERVEALLLSSGSGAG